jgi:hypothetical protein
MRCPKCNSTWISTISVTECPFCEVNLAQAYAESPLDLGDFFKLMVKRYGEEIYNNPKRLSDLIEDLFQGDKQYANFARKIIIEHGISEYVKQFHYKSMIKGDFDEDFLNDITTRFYYNRTALNGVFFALHKGLGINLLDIDLSNNGLDICYDGRGGYYSLDETEFVHLDYDYSETSYIVKDGVTTILEKAFSYTNVSRLYMPNSLLSVNREAFSNSKLSDITFGKKLKFIGEYAFCSCPLLREIKLPPHVKVIESKAFAYCNSLRDVILPASLESIGKNLFEGCGLLQNIQIPHGTRPHFEKLLSLEYHNKLYEAREY